MTGDLRICAVVPTFDNPRTVRAAVEAVRAHLPDVILVDDGSGPPGRAACEAIAGDGLASLVRRDRNGGKGAAVKAGFLAARERGCTHVFQVDADLQHDVARVPAFLAAAREHPQALVLGHPVYDAGAPRSRRWARRITTFWVAVELGRSDRIVDALVGFRVYPLQAALDARARTSRMDFDIEIAVRMARRGTPVINLPVGVRYLSPQDGGVSHFDMLGDNLRFFGMHTRLCMEGVFGWAGRRVGAGRR